MGYKTTTDPFVLRGETSMTITGTGASDTANIDTSLDTLNREVLLIWEVDIERGSIPVLAMDGVANSASAADLRIHDSVQTTTNAANLNDSDYIAGVHFEAFSTAGPTGPMIVTENRNPDSREFSSRDRIPLAIVTDSTIVVRSGFSSNITHATSDTYSAKFRVMAQRAKADADTYAALVTGLL